MQLNLPPDAVRLIEKRLATGDYSTPEEVVRTALLLQDERERWDAEEDWTEEEKLEISAKIEEGFRQAERGEFITPEQAIRELEAFKAEWRAKRAAIK